MACVLHHSRCRTRGMTCARQCLQAAAEGRRAAEEEAEGLRVALAAARTAADAARAQLTAEQIGAQQRLAAFEKLKQDLEV